MAAEAPGLELHTGIILLALHHPVEVAESLATLDVISGGRLVAGFGLGYREPEFAGFGVPRGERVINADPDAWYRAGPDREEQMGPANYAEWRAVGIPGRTELPHGERRNMRRRYFETLLQRSVKIVGTFAKQPITRGRMSYLEFIPPTIESVRRCLSELPEYRALETLLPMDFSVDDARLRAEHIFANERMNEGANQARQRTKSPCYPATESAPKSPHRSWRSSNAPASRSSGRSTSSARKHSRNSAILCRPRSSTRSCGTRWR